MLPVVPMVAVKAKASITPPNWASTEQAATTVRRRMPVGFAVDTAYASSAPMAAPVTAEMADSPIDQKAALRTAGSVSTPKLASVSPPVGVWKALTTTIAVGSTRNRPT